MVSEARPHAGRLAGWPRFVRGGSLSWFTGHTDLFWPDNDPGQDTLASLLTEAPPAHVNGHPRGRGEADRLPTTTNGPEPPLHSRPQEDHLGCGTTRRVREDTTSMKSALCSSPREEPPSAWSRWLSGEGRKPSWSTGPGHLLQVSKGRAREHGVGAEVHAGRGQEQTAAGSAGSHRPHRAPQPSGGWPKAWAGAEGTGNQHPLLGCHPRTPQPRLYHRTHCQARDCATSLPPGKT